MTAMRAVFVLLFCLQAVSAQNFALLVRNCRDKHIERLNECIVSAIKRIQPLMGDGIPSLNLPAMEPLFLEDIIFGQSEGSVTINSRFRNVMVSGASKFDLRYFDWHFENNKVYMGMIIPMMIMTGQYNITGRVFQLPVQGDGDFITMLDGVVSQSVGDLIVDSQGKTQLANLHIDFDIMKLKTKMMNLFNGNQVLSDTLHHFVNNNAQVILEEIRPELTRQLNEFVTGLLQALLSALPNDVLTDVANANTLDKHRKRTIELQAARAVNRV